MLGRFSKPQAVIPFIRTPDSTVIFDPRFAPFVDQSSRAEGRHLTRESDALSTTGDFVMLETAATGKSRAILDTGRRKFMIYVKCESPATEELSATTSPREVAATGDRLFPAMITEVQKCTSESSNDAFIEKARGCILADICARWFFMNWILHHFPETTPEQFLVAQLAGGRLVMWSFYKELIKYPTTVLQQLPGVLSAIPLPRHVDQLIWALDEAQVAAAYFSSDTGRHFKSSDNKHARSLLSEYFRLLKREDVVAARQVIVAGTGLTTFAAKGQLHTQLGKQGSDRRLRFPILSEDDVKERLGRVLNLDGVDWNQVDNLPLVTGRCRWSARLVDLISDKECNLQSPMPKTQVVKRAIATLRDQVTRKLVHDIDRRLESSRIDEQHREQDRSLIRRMYLICSLFHDQAKGVKMFFTGKEVNTLLALGLGQFEGEKGVVEGGASVHFDRMTVEALNAYALKYEWNVPDVVATWLHAQREMSKAQDLGVKFQLMVAAALHGLSGTTVADFAIAVAQASGQNVEALNLPEWTYHAVITVVGFTTLSKASDVLEFFNHPEIGVIVEPDDLMRPDGVVILDGGEYRFLLAYSAKLWKVALAGARRNDDLASLDPTTWYTASPSKRKRAGKGKKNLESKTAEEEESVSAPVISKPKRTRKEKKIPDDKTTEEQLKSNHDHWMARLRSITEATAGRQVRLYASPAGYASYEDHRTDLAAGIVNGELLHVHVVGDSVRIIIDQSNADVLFRSAVQGQVLRDLSPIVTCAAEQA